jgi:hypothetical protein
MFLVYIITDMLECLVELLILKNAQLENSNSYFIYLNISSKVKTVRFCFCVFDLFTLLVL